ncbi:MAG: lgt 2 [Verrucomicrobiales bacterium]|nr:lgt 2 [Verrucomicrobiales bacterium]
MHKILVSEPHIASYSACLLLALIAGYLISRWRAVRVGLEGAHIDNMTLLIAVSSLFGARVFSWWFEFPEGVSPWSALTNASGGMVFYGGMIFGAIAVVAYAACTCLSLGNLMDACAPGLALGLAIGRIGCFMAGCCWGDVCISDAQAASIHDPSVLRQVRTFSILSPSTYPLAVTFPPDAGATEQHCDLGLTSKESARSLPVHPVQLYETAFALLLCLYLHRAFKRREWEGEIIWQFMFGYGVIRFSLEFFRADNPAAFAGLTLSQLISIGMVVAAITVFRSHKSHIRVARLNHVRLD